MIRLLCFFRGFGADIRDMRIPVARVHGDRLHRKANPLKDLQIFFLASEVESFAQGESDHLDGQGFLEEIPRVFPSRHRVHLLDDENAARM